MTTAAPRPTDHRSRLRDTKAAPYWLDRREHPTPPPRLTADTTCDLAVVGGGYTGLWTALLAKRAHPERDVLVLEENSCGHAASGRNGGFCSPSITHGLANGADRWPTEARLLHRLGMATACLGPARRLPRPRGPIAEHAEVTALTTRHAGRVRLATPYAGVGARHVALATNIYRPLLKRLSVSMIPVCDYALTTEPTRPRLRLLSRAG